MTLVARSPAGRRHDRRLAGAAIAAPLVWLATLEASYVLAEHACRQHARWPVGLATALGFAVVAALGLVAWRRTAGGDARPFLRHAAAASAALFALVIAAQAIPILVLRACD